MKGSISQLVALTSAANGVLSGCVDLDTFYPTHSAFVFCNAVRFVDIKKGQLGKFREVERHKDPNGWLQSLAKKRLNRAWLTYSSQNEPGAPDHQLAAFVGGGGDWKLVISVEDEIEFWKSRWEVTNKDAADRRIWGVTYGCVQKISAQLHMPQPNLDLAASRLLTALSAIKEFAASHDLSTWADWFQTAIGSFDETDQVKFPDYIDFICLSSYPEIAQRLFAAAYNGWVFGGMGSWNDLYFEPEAENDRYFELSGELYSAMTDAIQKATWSFGSA